MNTRVMFILHSLLLMLLFVHTLESATIQDASKNELQTANSIVAAPKQEYYYQQVLQQPIHQAQYVPVRIIPKPVYVPQPQPTTPTMIIITAHPALISNAMLGATMQQLLNYFHSNPQARNQLLYGSMQQQVATQNVGQYVPTPNYYQNNYVSPQNYVRAQPEPEPQLNYAQAQDSYLQNRNVPHFTQTSVPNQQHGHLGYLAQLSAQHYANSNTQLKSAPAIITGLENFSPEQQIQIKKQLSSYLGTPLNAMTPVSQQDDTNSKLRKISAKYVSQQSVLNDFIPSQPIKMPPSNGPTEQTKIH